MCHRFLIFHVAFLFFRLRASKILLIGLNGLGAEAAKNIILSGVKSITFLDHRNSSEVDKCSQFFIADYNGKNVRMTNNKLY